MNIGKGKKSVQYLGYKFKGLRGIYKIFRIKNAF